MSKDTGTISTNVYEALGYADPELMQAKAGLVAEMQSIIEQRGMKRKEAADLLSIAPPNLSNILNGHFEKTSIEKLMSYLRLLGKNTEIVIKDAPSNSVPHLSVVVDTVNPETGLNL